MASQENLEHLIGGSWRKDYADLHEAVTLAVDDLGKLVKLASGVKISIKADSKQFKKDMDEAVALQKQLQAQSKTLEIQTRQLEQAKQQEAKTSREQAKASEAKSKADKAEAAALREKQKQQENSNKASKEEVKSTRELAKAISEANKERQRVAKEIAKEEAAIAKQKGAYAQLSGTYNRVSKEAQNLGAEIELLKLEMSGNATPAYTARLATLQKQFNESSATGMRLHQSLLKIDESVGKSQRNVGNYKSQWNGLNFSIQQLVREVPSTASNIAMLPLALSNNIGPLIDSLKQARVANEALKASGQKTIPVWKQVGAAIFSWQTALMAGIALLVAYSSSSSAAERKVGDFAEALKSAGNEYAEAKIKLEAWSEALKKGEMSIAQKEAAMEEYNRTLGDQMGKVKTISEWENKIIKDTPTFIKVLLLRAKATAAIAAANELYVENLKNEENHGKDLVSGFDKFVNYAKNIGKNAGRPGGWIASGFDDASDGLKELDKNTKKTEKSVESLTKKYLEFSAEAAELAKANGFDLDGKKNKKDPKAKKERDPKDLTNLIIEAQRDANEALAAMQTKNMAAEADRQKSISENEKMELADRLAAYELYYSAQRDLAQVNYDKELEDINLQNEKLKHAIDSSNATPADKNKARIEQQKTYQLQLDALLAKFDADALKRSTKYAEDTQKIVESDIKEQIRIIKNGADEIEAQIIDSENEKLVTLRKYYEAGNMSFREYQRQRRDIQQQADLEIFNAQKKYFENYIDDLEKQGKLTVEVARAIRAALAKEMPGGGRSAEVGSISDMLGMNEEGIKQAQAYTDITIGLIDSISNAMQARHNAEIANLEDGLDKIKDKYKQEEDFINTLAITDEEREKKLQDLKARSTLAELQQHHRIVDAKRKAARADKQANTAEAIGKTAIAVMQALTVKPWYLGAALAVAAGITGAAQIAAIQATPLPQYAKGTKSKPADGLAVVGEKGSEAYRLPTGQWGVTPATSTVMDLPKGTEIFTAQQTNEMMKQSALKNLALSGKRVNEWEYMKAMVAMTQAQENGSRRIEKAIERSKPNITIINQDSSYINRITQH